MAPTNPVRSDDEDMRKRGYAVGGLLGEGSYAKVCKYSDFASVFGTVFADISGISSHIFGVPRSKYLIIQIILKIDRNFCNLSQLPRQTFDITTMRCIQKSNYTHP